MGRTRNKPNGAKEDTQLSEGRDKEKVSEGEGDREEGACVSVCKAPHTEQDTEDYCVCICCVYMLCVYVVYICCVWCEREQVRKEKLTHTSELCKVQATQTHPSSSASVNFSFPFFFFFFFFFGWLVVVVVVVSSFKVEVEG